MVVKKLGLLIAVLAAVFAYVPSGVLAQGVGTTSVSAGAVPGTSGVGTTGVSAGVPAISGVGIGALGSGSLGSATAPVSATSGAGNTPSLPGSSTVQSGNALFRNPIGIGQNPSGARSTYTAQQQRNLGIGQSSNGLATGTSQ